MNVYLQFSLADLYIIFFLIKKRQVSIFIEFNSKYAIDIVKSKGLEDIFRYIRWISTTGD